MRKKVLVLLISISMVINFAVPVFALEGASEESTTVDQNQSISDKKEIAGITPDSKLYKLERMIEDIQLSIAKSEERLALLQSKFALERAAEAAIMVTEDQQELAEKATQEYLVSLEAVAVHLSAAVEASEKAIVAKDGVIKALENAKTIYGTITEGEGYEESFSEVIATQDEVIASVNLFYLAKENFFAAKEELNQARKELIEARKSRDTELIQKLEEQVRQLEENKDDLEQLKDDADEAKEELKGNAEEAREFLKVAEKELKTANKIMDNIDKSVEKQKEVKEGKQKGLEKANESREKALEKAREAKERGL